MLSIMVVTEMGQGRTNACERCRVIWRGAPASSWGSALRRHQLKANAHFHDKAMQLLPDHGWGHQWQ